MLDRGRERERERAVLLDTTKRRTEIGFPPRQYMKNIWDKVYGGQEVGEEKGGFGERGVGEEKGE